MTPNEDRLRNRLMSRIDALLARSLLVWGEDRALLSAIRGYVANMSDEELRKLRQHLPESYGDD